MLAWYDRTRRDLPWRETDDPYRIWVSEIMLQQTQVKTVVPYYRRWMEAFPTVEKLAAAPERKVLKLWEGLGYYSRARNLKKSAGIVAREMNGRVPDTLEGLRSLPGIGRYTAGAIASIAFGMKTPVLDSNVKRVVSRLFRLNENGSTAASEKRLWQAAEDLLPARRTGDFNQALMELGATVCLPKSPACPECPLHTSCEAARKGDAQRFPPARRRTATEKIEVSAGIISKNGKVYIQQRIKGGLMGGLWEFPGGKREKGESPEACLKREIREELGIGVTHLKKVLTLKHAYTRFQVTLHVFRCRLNGGRLRPAACEQWKWVSPAKLDTYPFPSANVKIVEYLTHGTGRGVTQSTKPAKAKS
ncbi:adenine glycosylase [Candidatus Nitromaritima sp. SCGC AAA799-C22]|nr:adenine glycosylase [Candidatus Nitromaritima sp. SCGC AAA799-C22]